MLGGFLVGMIVGCVVGVFTACLLVAARGNSAHLPLRESIEAGDRRDPGSDRRRSERSVYFALSGRPTETKLRSHLRDILREATTSISVIPLGVWVGPLHHPEVEDRVKLGDLVPGALIEMMNGVPFYLGPDLPPDRIRVVIGVRKKGIVSQGDTLQEKVSLEAEMA
jgi:hypothetical protein